MRTRFALVPECGPGVGLGHLDRLLAVAVGMGDESLMVLPDDTTVIERVGHHNVPFRVVDGPIEVRAAAAAAHADVVVVDAYTLPLPAQHALREHCRLVLVDDLSSACDVDILVNPSVGAPSSAPSGAGRYHFGVDYAPVSDEILAVRRRRIDERAPSGSILVSTGAMSGGGLGARVVSELLRAPGEQLQSVTWVIGPDDATAHATADPRLTVSRAPRTLAGHLLCASVMCGAAGTTAIQAACCGVPSVLVATHANQDAQVRGLAAAGAAVMSTPDGCATDAIALVGDGARLAEMARDGRRLVDGLGTMRFIDAVLDAQKAAIRT